MRGQDTHGNFELEPEPACDFDPAAVALHQKADEEQRKIYQEEYPDPTEAAAELTNIVKANPHTRKDYFHVVFNEYGDSSLQVMLYCFLNVPDWATELVERQNIYLEIFRLADDLGVEFAFPTQTLHVESLPETNSPESPDPLDVAQLSATANQFGPKSKSARPGGLGIFTPPYRDSDLST